MKFQKFCKICGMLLTETFWGSKQYFTFEDGDYCPKCAKIRVEQARKKLNK